MEPSIPFVILMGLGVVFFGLICIVLLCMLMGVIIRAIEKKRPSEAPKENSASAPAAALSPEKRREIIAAVSAVIAEELGADVSAIRVISFKQV